MTDRPAKKASQDLGVAKRSSSTFLRKLTKHAAEWLVVLLITFLGGEAASRWILGITPLTSEALVWEHDDRWGWRHRPNSQDTFVKLGCRQTIQINSHGLREREIPYDKPEGAYRVLVVGDSGVVGFEVAQQDVFPRVAESILRRQGYAVEFINGGHRGFGTDQSLLFLQDEGLKYSPDLVLYKWNRNDRDDNATVHRPFRRFGKAYFTLTPGGELILKGVPVPRYPYERQLRVAADGAVHESAAPPSVRFQMWIRDHAVSRSAFVTALVHVTAAVPQLKTALKRTTSYSDADPSAASPDTSSRIFGLTAALIREMERASREAGAKFRMIGPIDVWAAALREELALPSLGEYERFLSNRPADGRLNVPFDNHWNELGHRLYGEALAAALVQSGLLPPVANPRNSPATNVDGVTEPDRLRE